LNRTQVLNLWNYFAISHVLKDNLRIANYNWICNIIRITINAAVCVISNVLSYLLGNSLFSITITLNTISTHLHHWHRILRFQWPVSINNLLCLLRTYQLRSLMQLIALIISYGWISSKMLFRIIDTWFLALNEIVFERLEVLRWLFWSLMLMMHVDLFNRISIDKIIQIQLLLICSLSVIPISVILEAVLWKFWEVLDVRILSIGYCLWLLLIFNCVKALSTNIFFLILCWFHMVYRLEFHLGVLCFFVSCFRISLDFVITSINWSQVSTHSCVWSILINSLSKLCLFDWLILIGWKILLNYLSTMLWWWRA
jgi:hypothetical protein